jgi:hypothetical protein
MVDSRFDAPNLIMFPMFLLSCQSVSSSNVTPMLIDDWQLIRMIR